MRQLGKISVICLTLIALGSVHAEAATSKRKKKRVLPSDQIQSQASAPAKKHAAESDEGGAGINMSYLSAGAQVGLGGAVGGLPAFAFGVDGLYRVIPNLHVGFEFSGITGSLGSVLELMPTGRYYFWQGMYGSLGIGLGLVVFSPFFGIPALAEAAISPSIGYDFQVMPKLSVGPRFQYIANFGNGSAHVLTGTATVRYQF